MLSKSRWCPTKPSSTLCDIKRPMLQGRVALTIVVLGVRPTAKGFFQRRAVTLSWPKFHTCFNRLIEAWPPLCSFRPPAWKWDERRKLATNVGRFLTILIDHCLRRWWSACLFVCDLIDKRTILYFTLMTYC